MANFIKLGTAYINLDHVRAIYLDYERKDGKIHYIGDDSTTSLKPKDYNEWVEMCSAIENITKGQTP
jgi:hypothetical protein